jgi:hypothetical protein
MMHANKSLGIRSVVLGSFVALATLVACSGSDKPGGAGGGSSSGTAGYIPTTAGDGSANREGGEGGAEGGNPDGGGGDASETDSSTLPDGAPLPAACLGVAREGTDIAEVSIAAAPPAASGGGPIAPGKYLLTKWETYSGVGGTAGPTGEIRRTTLIISGSQAQYAPSDVDGANDMTNVSYQFLLSGTTFDSTEICPVPTRPRTRGYTVNGAVLTLDEPFGTLTRRLFYTKQ